MSILDIIAEGHIKERAAAARKRIRERGTEHACERIADTAILLLSPLECMDTVSPDDKAVMAHELKEAIFAVLCGWVKDPYAGEKIVPDEPLVDGREAYEADLLLHPTYHDGRARPSWENLSDIARRSWQHAPSRGGLG